MTKLITLFKTFTADDSGAVASEYAVLLVLIAAALVLAVVFLSESIQYAITLVANVLVGDATGITAPSLGGTTP